MNWLADLPQQLRYQRSRASSPVQALHATREALLSRMAASRAWPRQVRAALCLAERRAFALGISYPRSNPEWQCAPWHLPSALRDAREPLPVHPLIDPAFAAQQLQLPAADGGGLAVLQALAEPAQRAQLWRELPCWRLGDPPATQRIAVVLHLFYPALWPEMRAALERLPERPMLYVSVPEFAATPALRALVDDWPDLRFVPQPNRGRDVAPFVHLARSGALNGHAWVLKLHTKRSPHLQDGATWRRASLEALCQPSADLHQALAEPSNGMLCAQQDWVAADDGKRWTRHSDRHLKRLSAWLAPPAGLQRWPFAAGTMFWVRPQLLAPLRHLPTVLPFEPEMAQVDGSFAHALERWLGLLPLQAGLQLRALPAEVL